MDTFYQVAKDYPDIEATDAIVDDLAMKLVMYPQRYEMIILTNLQGDILSDLCAGLVGGLGFAPSSNIGDRISIFEAVHGTAPDIAGRNLANPTALLLSSLMMLRRMGLPEYADRIENALLYCLEQGIHTGDFGSHDIPPCGTDKFAGYIIQNLGKKPVESSPRETPEAAKRFKKPGKPEKQSIHTYPAPKKSESEGIDVYVNFNGLANELAEKVQPVIPKSMQLQTISNRGTQVWPESSIFTECVPHYRLRILFRKNTTSGAATINQLISDIGEILDISECQWLRSFDGKKGYALAQGQ